jgi:iron complex outermembrane receptor protein
VGARVSASAGSFGYQGASASASYGGEKVSAQAGFSYRRSDPFRDGHGLRFTQYGNYRPDQEDSEAFRVGTGWAGLFFSPDDHNHFRATYTRQEADHVLYPYLLMDGIYDNTDRFQAGYEHQGEGALKALRLQGYATHVSHWMTDAYRTSSTMAPRGFGMGTYAKTRAFGGRVELEWPVFTAGVEATRREWDTVTQMAGMMYAPQYSIPDVDARTLGFYGLFEKSLSSTVTLKAGGRYDFFGSSAEPLKANKSLYLAYHDTVSTLTRKNGASANIRLLWAPRGWLDLSAGVGTTLRFPDPQELYFGLRRMGADWVGNPELQPSRNTAAELGLTFHHGGNSLKVTLFRDQVQDFITVYDQRKIRMVPGVMNPIAKSYANVDAVLWGGELSASAVLWGQVFLMADVAGVRGTKDPRPDLGIRSDNLSEIPPLSGRLAVRYDVGRYFAEVEGAFASAQDDVDEDLEEATTPGWGVCNFKAGARWKGFSLTLSANNLFNRYYVEHLSYQRDPFRSGVRVPEPGRNFTVFLSWRY